MTKLLNNRRIKNLLKGSGLWSCILIIVLIVLINFAIGDISNTVNEQQLVNIENALRRAAVQCYSLEGRYPPSLNYIVDNYGLQYDSEEYVIHYQSLGGNLLPQISVFYLSE